MGTSIVKKDLSFGTALESLKNGRLVSRAGWDGKGMYLALVRPYRLAEPALAPFVCDVVCGPQAPRERLVQLPWIGMRTANAEYVPWLASQTNLLSDDWCVVEVVEVGP